MKKEITIRELAAELIARIDRTQGVDCCKDEIKTLARMAGERMGDEKISVTWKEG